MVKPRFRIYYKGVAPTGAKVIQPAIATREHKVSEPFPFMGEAWELVGICALLGHKDTKGNEICEGDILRMPDDSLGIVYYNINDCSYTIITGDDTYAIGYTRDGRIVYEIIGNRFIMPEVSVSITEARIKRYNSEAR